MPKNIKKYFPNKKETDNKITTAQDVFSVIDLYSSSDLFPVSTIITGIFPIGSIIANKITNVLTSSTVSTIQFTHFKIRTLNNFKLTSLINAATVICFLRPKENLTTRPSYLNNLMKVLLIWRETTLR